MRARYDIRSERTAKRRTEIPVPIQDALDEGLIRPGVSVFDYGEGRGELCPKLERRGIRCAGWDPGHSPGKPKQAADVVALNFVLNVIPDPQVRAEALREAHRLARQALVIGVRGRSDERSTKTKVRYGDGFLVGRGRVRTFQKFYSPEEFVRYARRVLGRPVRMLRRDPVVVVVDRR
jgi:DNA phosphorothioation-associated putative methyltransferase